MQNAMELIARTGSSRRQRIDTQSIAIRGWGGELDTGLGIMGLISLHVRCDEGVRGVIAAQYDQHEMCG
jgi:hypothetical protein